MDPIPPPLRNCILEPSVEVRETGLLIEEAGLQLLAGNPVAAAAALKEADMPSLLVHFQQAEESLAIYSRHSSPIPRPERGPRRSPTSADLRRLFARDGWKCRFCGMRVIESQVRDKLRQELPEAARWGPKNTDRHAGLFIHSGSHDHILPWSHGGTNALDNMVVACWTCQFSRGNWLLEEIGVLDPRCRDILVDGWDGLRRIL